MRTFRLLLLSAFIVSSPMFAASRFYMAELQNFQNPNGVGTLVKVIDQATNTLTGSITVNQSPSNVRASAGDGSRVYVSYTRTLPLALMIGAIDTVTNTLVQSVPGFTLRFAAISADGTRIYAAGSASINVLDTTTMTVLPSISLPGSHPAQVAVSADGTRLYVGDGVTGDISIVNTSTGAIVNTIPETPCTLCNGTDVGTHALVMSSDGTRLYAQHGGNRALLTAFDTATNTALLTTSGLVGILDYMRITPDGNEIYGFAPLDDGPYYVIGTADLIPHTIGDFSDAWSSVAFTQDSSSAYMTHFGNNGAVAQVSVASNTVLADIPLNTGGGRSSPYDITRVDVPSGSPFSTYSVTSVRFKPSEADVKATFTTSGTVNPPAQRFTYVLGAYGIQIPAGSFTGSGTWTYAGTLNGIDIQAKITTVSSQNYTLSLTLKTNSAITSQQLPLNTMLELGSSLYGTAVAN